MVGSDSGRSDSIVLIITKVDDPQELDTRFSKFAPSSDEGDSQAPVQYSGADDIIDLFQKIYEARTKAEQKKSCFRRERRCGSSRKGCPCGSCPYLPFSFAGRSHLFSKRTGITISGKILYKIEPQNEYQLVLHQSGCSPDFNKICNILLSMDSKKRFPASEKRIWQSTARFWSAIPLFSSLLNLPDPYKKAPAEKGASR